MSSTPDEDIFMPKIDDETADTLTKIAGVPDFHKSDSAIKSNGIVQFSGSITMLIIYFICRNKTPWVYYPNIKNKPQHPCYQHRPGIFSWIYPLITTKDKQLLSTVGLDGFMMLQTIKLLYRICFVLSVIIVTIMPIWLWSIKTQKRVGYFFIRLTIYDIKDPKIYWYALIMGYIVTSIILYLLFIYYKRFVTLRQLYLAAPATMTSIYQMKKISNELGDDQNAIDYVNVSSRTVIIDRLPSNIGNDKDLAEYIDSLKIGDVESVSLIHDTYNLQKMYEERDTIIQDIEKEISLALIKIKTFYKTEKEKCKTSFADLYNEELDKSVLGLFENTNFTMSEKVKIFNTFCKYADKFLLKTLFGKLVIGLNIAKLGEINDKILAEKERLETKNSEEESTVPKAKETLFVDSDVRNDVSFFSFSQLMEFYKNMDLFTLDFPINRKKGFVTFKDQRAARLLSEAKLGTRVFSSNISIAPAPHDVLWRNICRNEVSSFIFKLISFSLYALFIVAFLVLVVMIIQSLQIESNSENYVLRFLMRYETLYSLYKGLLVPLIYNILLFFVPIIIKALLHMENNNSLSGLQIKLMYRLSIFLFFNAFIATIILSCVISVITKIKYEAVTISSLKAEIGESIVKSSVFFFNTIVQRLCIGSMIVILKPSPFLYNWLIAPWAIYTRRQSIEREFSPPIDFGNHIPNLLLIFPMAIAYSFICPAMLVMAFIFYLFSYIVYKNELLFATRNDYETGGEYWKPCVKFIMFSLVSFQVITAILAYSMNFFYVFCLFLPLIFFTSMFSISINEIFENSSENLPINAPEENFLNNLSKKTLEERYKVLSEWKELREEVDEDLIPISELGVEDRNTDLKNSYYKDPSTRESIGNIILPKHFFKTIHFLKSFDKDNVFGLKK